MKTLISIFILAAVANAADTSKFDGALTTNLKGTHFHGSVKEGFHFNAEAPNQIKIDGKGIKPQSLKPREIDFELGSATFTNGQASLYVCDDALTFCQPNTIELKPGSSSKEKPGAAKTSMKASGKTKITKNKYGFIEDNLDAAAAQAKKQHKLVLIDFSARWCPGCIRLENEVFNTQVFRKASKDFVKVRLDYDRFDNLKIAKQYGIHGIPSLVAATADLEEISRSVDYQPTSTIAAFLSDAKSNPLPFDALEKKADEGDKAAALTLGQRLYASSRYSQSISYLAQAKPEPVELRVAKVQAAKAAMKDDEKLKPLFQTASREALAQESSTSRSLIWRTDLAESLTDPKEKKNLGIDGLAVGEKILANPDQLEEALKGDPIGEFAGFERMYVASERADLAEAAGLDEATQQAARLRVTEIGKELHIPVQRKGPSLRYLIFLTAAKQYAEAETQVRAMLKLEPKNPELERRLIKILNFEKKYDEAIKVGREALPESFGKNEVWVAQQLAKAYVGAGKKQEAAALAQSYLARTDIDWDVMKSEQKDLSEIAGTTK